MHIWKESMHLITVAVVAMNCFVFNADGL